MPVLDFLAAALESVEYERALTRGLVSRAENPSSILDDVLQLTQRRAIDEGGSVGVINPTRLLMSANQLHRKCPSAESSRTSRGS